MNEKLYMFISDSLDLSKFISRSVTVTVEEDQINTATCSPGAFIRQRYMTKVAVVDVMVANVCFGNLHVGQIFV